jgi:hypothetical protein
LARFVAAQSVGAEWAWREGAKDAKALKYMIFAMGAIQTWGCHAASPELSHGGSPIYTIALALRVKGNLPRDHKKEWENHIDAPMAYLAVPTGKWSRKSFGRGRHESQT